MRLGNLGCGLCLLLMVSATAPAQDRNSAWIDLLSKTDFSKPVAGQWSKSAGEVNVNAIGGARVTLNWQPTVEYDYEVSFTRKTGRDSIALLFVHGGKQAAFEVDAWGQNLAGIQNVRNQDLRQNPTRVANQALKNGKRHTMRVAVRKTNVTVYLDNKQLARHETTGSDLSPVRLWQLPNQNSLGVGSWNSATTFHTIRVKPVGSGTQIASAPSSNPQTTQPRPPAPTPIPTRPANNLNGNSGKRVLIVIANRDFFYREYGDPRAELEKAGFTVEVAAGAKSPCTPHTNSGQRGSGVVNPDYALADVDPSRYAAILFSGGWGSSAYQYAFDGQYSNRTYNGNPAVKRRVNELINTFVKQDKYVCALCHGVSVLAWSRVNNRSLLAGKRATAPQRQSPLFTRNGRRTQPPSRWNAETNGARMVPAGSVGNPNTSADDVVVDGKILTGENDNSAAAAGRVLANLLKAN